MRTQTEKSSDAGPSKAAVESKAPADQAPSGNEGRVAPEVFDSGPALLEQRRGSSLSLAEKQALALRDLAVSVVMAKGTITASDLYSLP
jgi:hypothetical protein